ncbi:hypothetical protein ACFC8N_42700 [Streptomyces sp. NPDC055966]|uniref:hypothetical protein n=1 Tax=Streptomyces sp. NPDC055966 TaxID=3345669 RepID=UPI0035DC32E3
MKQPDPRTLEAVPPVVTFATGADLLVRLNLVKNMTREGVRRISKHPDWPFGPDRPHPYWLLANAEVMETEPFLEFFRDHPIVGRGPDKEPGRRSKASAQQ